MSKTINNQQFERGSGVLLHISSLPGDCFHGDLGKGAYEFVDYLANAGQKWWQFLPINPVGGGNSPYSTISACANEPLYIDLNDLVTMGLLKKAEISAPNSASKGAVNYEASRKFRYKRLRIAFERALEKKQVFNTAAFKEFDKKNKYWLADYALFSALIEKHGTDDWTSWPKAIRDRQATALKEAKKELAEEIKYYKFIQFLFQKQWDKLKAYATKKGVQLMGDIPIFVSFHSVDVWIEPTQFLIKANKRPSHVAGVPPDRSNPKGQLWGNALYNWEVMEKNRFQWWVNRFKRQLDLFDAIRIDHFIGFYRTWRIPANAKTVDKGRWELTPGEKLFKTIRKKLGELPIIAEDLGKVIPEVWELRDKLGFPGMRVLQFGFGDDNGQESYHLPLGFTPNSVVYPGTHDNETTVGWFKRLKKESSRSKKDGSTYQTVKEFFNSDDKDIHWAVIKAAMASPAVLSLFPMQDILGLDNKDRMNTPGIAKNQWRWRLKKGELSKATANKLNLLSKIYFR